MFLRNLKTVVLHFQLQQKARHIIHKCIWFDLISLCYRSDFQGGFVWYSRRPNKASTSRRGGVNNSSWWRDGEIVFCAFEQICRVQNPNIPPGGGRAGAGPGPAGQGGAGTGGTVRPGPDLSFRPPNNVDNRPGRFFGSTNVLDPMQTGSRKSITG